MRNIAKVLFLAICFNLVLGLSNASANEAKENVIHKSDSVINKITQKGVESIELTKFDRSKLSRSLIAFNSPVQEEKKEVKKVAEVEKKVMTANERRLAHYKPKLDAYTPPKEEISILVTGYSSTPDQTWGDPFTTASGTRVHLGTMACPPQYPFGTKVSIEGRGTYICEDRGGAIKGNRFDMWFESRGEALQWGKRTVVAKIEK